MGSNLVLHVEKSWGTVRNMAVPTLRRENFVVVVVVVMVMMMVAWVRVSAFEIGCHQKRAAGWDHSVSST
jgi:hypothetical protein